MPRHPAREQCQPSHGAHHEFFPFEGHQQIYLQLSLNLRAIVSQRLVPSLDGKRVAALEILMDTPRAKDLIKKGQVDLLKEAMEQGIQEGSQTFDHVLFQLYQEGKIASSKH